jgi:hypothetical protein
LTVFSPTATSGAIEENTPFSLGNREMSLLPCSYLGAEVELSEERERHIRTHHPDLLPEHRSCIVEAVERPDQVRRSIRVGNARLFTKWFDGLRGGRYVVVVVVADPGREKRPWVITAYLARKLKEGEIEWEKS